MYRRDTADDALHTVRNGDKNGGYQKPRLKLKHNAEKREDGKPETRV